MDFIKIGVGGAKVHKEKKISSRFINLNAKANENNFKRNGRLHELDKRKDSLNRMQKSTNHKEKD